MTPFQTIWWGIVLIIIVAIYCDTLYHRTTSHSYTDLTSPDLDDPDDDDNERCNFVVEDEEEKELDTVALAAEDRRRAS